MVQYFRPRSLDEALAIRASRDVTIIAGGTDVYPAKTTRAGWGHTHHKDVLDISALPELDAISEDSDHWRFGAMVTWSDLIRASLPSYFAGYQQAARAVGGRQVQNRGTLVGNICTASPAGDGIPNLLALAASVELAGPAGKRLVAMADFLTGYRQTACGADEIVTGLIVPKLDNARGHFLKLGARSYLVISIVMVAGVIALGDDDRIATARIAVGSCSAVAQRLPALEGALLGKRPGEDLTMLVSDDHLSALKPIDDIRASGGYRRDAAMVLVRDLLAGLSQPKLRSAA